MKFSIVLASRERSQLLVQLVRSIEETTDDLSNVQVIVGIDDCDPEMHDCKRHVEGWYSWVKFFSQPRSPWLNRDYLDFGYKTYGTGKYAIICNDDCVFKTKHWDSIIEARMEEYLINKPDRIAYGYINDSLTHPGEYACFPLVTSEAVKASDMLICREFPSWSSDLLLRKLYDSINRVCDISEVLIFHDSYHVIPSKQRDRTSLHVEQINRNTAHNVFPIELYRQRLLDVILAKSTIKHI